MCGSVGVAVGVAGGGVAGEPPRATLGTKARRRSGVGVGDGVGVGEGVAVGDGVGVSVGVRVGDGVGVFVAVGVGVTDGVGEGVGVSGGALFWKKARAWLTPSPS